MARPTRRCACNIGGPPFFYRPRPPRGRPGRVCRRPPLLVPPQFDGGRRCPRFKSGGTAFPPADPGSLHRDHKGFAARRIGGRTPPGERDTVAGVRSRQLDHVHAKPGVPRWRLIACPPAVHAPRDHRRLRQLDPQDPPGGNAWCAPVRPPGPHARFLPVALVAPNQLRRRSNTAPSASEGNSFRCSACAQARGIADPLGPPGCNSRSGIGGPSQICSGSSLPGLAFASIAASNRLASAA